jgi:hypothetical protein
MGPLSSEPQTKPVRRRIVFIQPTLTSRPRPLRCIALLLLLALLPLGGGSFRPGAPPPSIPRPDFSRLPLAFAPPAGPTDPAAAFTTRAPGGTFTFAPGAVIFAPAAPPVERRPHRMDLPGSRAARAPGGAGVVRLQFLGANPAAPITGDTLLPGTVNVLRGNDPARWQIGLPTYAGITYEGLYPGVDLHYDGTQRRLKGTYTLAPGADPAQIRWRYDGAESVTLDADGNLRIAVLGSGRQSSGAGQETSVLVESAPVAWQERGGERWAVPARYAVAADGSVRFALGAYDPAHPLVIDPTLTYSSYLGGTFGDIGYAIAVDSAGNAYVTGTTQGTPFALGDLFVTKINAAGTAILYSTVLVGNDYDVGYGIAVDAAGHAYVTGESYSTDFPAVNAFQPQNGGFNDAILLKLNPAGTALIYSTYLGGLGSDQAWAIAVDGAGSAHLTGVSGSTNFPLASPFQGQRLGTRDVIVTKFTPDGQALAFSTYLGGTSAYDVEVGYGIVVDAAGGVYVTGYTDVANFPLHNPIQATNGGFADTFITKFVPAGTALAYSTYLGGEDNDIAYDITLDAAGNAYVAGYTSSTTFPVVNAYQPAKSGYDDVFVTKINPAGSAWLYSTYLGGIGHDGQVNTQIAVAADGSMTVAGDTQSSDFPVGNWVQQFHANPTYWDIFVTRIAPSGAALLYSTFLGAAVPESFTGYPTDVAYGLALDKGGNAYLTGQTNSPTWPIAGAPFQPNYGGGDSDGLVAKIDIDPAGPPIPPAPTPGPCATADYVITPSSGAPIVPGTVDIGNHCNLSGCTTGINLPFPVRLYDRTFTSAYIGSAGTLGFLGNQAYAIGRCLPTSHPHNLNFGIMAYWDYVETAGQCPAGPCGIYTSISGSAPNRIFNIEWRARKYRSVGNYDPVHFEIRLYENSTTFEVIYGAVSAGAVDVTAGVQRDIGSRYTQYSCQMAARITPGLKLTYTLPCGAPGTPGSTPTRTNTPLPTQTPGGPSATAVPSQTPLPGASPTATVCPIQFSDVPPNNPFYPFIRCLACRGLVSGYSDGTFGWPNPVTRGQLSKILANAGGLTNTIPSTQQTFSDVFSTNPFWVFIERLAQTGAISGYACGGLGEPCDPAQRPYFRWAAQATRGQISKITAVTAGWNGPIPTAQQTFTDVPPSNAFWPWIEELAGRGIISGYACGGAGEPCDPQSRPYFRWTANATRGQMAKIAAETFFPNCWTPAGQ